MRNTTNSYARQRGKRELQRIFKDCRIKDALTLNEQDAPTPDDFIYYYNKARDGQVGNYIVYETIASEGTRRADDVVIAREFYAQVDVFSVKSFESKLLQDLLEKIEEKLTAAGFEIDMREEAFEADTRLYHVALFLSKIYNK